LDVGLVQRELMQLEAQCSEKDAGMLCRVSFGLMLIRSGRQATSGVAGQ
jgi:hypothetical protein